MTVKNNSWYSSKRTKGDSEGILKEKKMEMIDYLMFNHTECYSSVKEYGDKTVIST